MYNTRRGCDLAGTCLKKAHTEQGYGARIVFASKKLFLENESRFQVLLRDSLL